jgi:hypothetical protein
MYTNNFNSIPAYGKRVVGAAVGSGQCICICKYTYIFRLDGCMNVYVYVYLYMIGWMHAY